MQLLPANLRCARCFIALMKQIFIGCFPCALHPLEARSIVMNKTDEVPALIVFIILLGKG